MSKPRAENIAHVSAVIKRRAMTIPEISVASGISQPCVRDVLDVLQTEGNVHIKGWKLEGRSYRYVARFIFGPGIDAPKPPNQTAEERRAKNRAYKARHAKTKMEKADAERRERIRKELARPAFRDPLVAALFGEYERRAA
jgi:hypothetical protein